MNLYEPTGIFITRSVSAIGSNQIGFLISIQFDRNKRKCRHFHCFEMCAYPELLSPKIVTKSGKWLTMELKYQ